MTSVVTGTAAKPPLATPLTLTGTIILENAIDRAQTAGLAPATVDKRFSNAYLQSWNFNVQRELTGAVAVMAGYFGSKGTHLILRRNINQPIDGVRPFPAVSSSSSILAGTPLGNITQVKGDGNSTYNALWISAGRAVARGLQVNASYTWSKSIDYNSLSSQGNSYDLRADRGPSSFDTRPASSFAVFMTCPSAATGSLKAGSNADFSIIRRTDLGEGLHIELRAEVFDFLNHANLGQPGNAVGTPAFGRIVNTRFPTGESGSSRQVQFGVKLTF